MLKNTTHLICSLVLIVIGQVTLAQEVRIVAPAGLESSDGSLSVPNEANLVVRTQELWAASDFGDLPEGGAWLIGYADRLDASATNGATLTQDVTISISTSPRDSIARSYDANIGDDVVQVFSGEVTRQYQVADGSTNPFGTPFVFETPFFYDPSKGDLLLDLQFNGGSGSSVVYDSHDIGSPAGNFGSLSGASSDGFFNDHIVTEFIFDVPEPSGLSLGMIGCLGLLLRGDRRT